MGFVQRREEVVKRKINPNGLTTGQVAEMLGVHPRTLKKLVDAGQFPHAYRLSPMPGGKRAQGTAKSGNDGHWRIPLADVEAYLASRVAREDARRRLAANG